MTAYGDIEAKGYFSRDAVEKAIYALHHASKGHRDMAESAADIYALVKLQLSSIKAERDMWREKYEQVTK